MIPSRPVDRRTALRYGASALALGAAYACAPRSLLPPTAAPPLTSMLPAPRVERERVIRTVAGLRPYRASGYRVEVEALGDTLLIHNYGHGGAGVTLSWGSAQQAVELALRQPHREAAVIGCGAVGLATARLLQDHGFRTVIHARDLPPNTTSNVAGALWAPYGVASWGQRQSAFATGPLARAARFSHRYFQSLVGEEYAVRWLPLFLLNQNPDAGIPWPMQLTPELYNARRLEPGEHPFAFPGAWRMNTMMIEPDPYLRAVMRDFQLRGGRISVRSFSATHELQALDERVVFNCTGLGARDLVGDEELVPVRGQLAFLLPQPEVEYMYIAGGSYMFPRRDGILLGGTSEEGEWSTAPEPEKIEEIIRGNREVARGMVRG